MRSIYRIKRLAISSGSVSRPSVARPISTTSFRAKEQPRASQLDLSELPSEASASSIPSTARWSDAGAEERSGRNRKPIAESSSFTNQSASGSSSGFFTPFRPSTTLPVPPASQSDPHSLRSLYTLLYRDPALRDDALCTRIWREYHTLSASSRRSLHPKVMQMVLRAVIPNREARMDWKRKVKDPVQGLAAYAEKMERRLQVVIADMTRSTWVDPSTGLKTASPDYQDYSYAMLVLARLGGSEACEAMYREIRDKAPRLASHHDLLKYRLRALKTWMTGRVRFANFTRQRPPLGASAPPPSGPGSLRFRPENASIDPAAHTITALWSILRDLGTSMAQSDSGVLYHELVVTLRQALRFLPEEEIKSIETVRKILKQALEKGYGIDFHFLRQDPSSTQTITSEVLESVVYLMGSQGDVWRMVAMHEALVGPGVGSSSSATVEGMSDMEDMGETLSEAMRVEEESRDAFDWLGRARSTVAEVAAPVADADVASPADSSLSPQETEADTANRTRVYDDFLTSVPSSIPLGTGSSDSAGTSASSCLTTTNTVTTMIDAIKQTGDIDLAVHLLRTSLRDASTVRHAWLTQVLQRQSNIPASDPESESAIPPLASDAMGIEALPDRSLLVSAQWFEAVHLLARKGAHSSWAAVEVRRLVELEIQAVREEYSLLTGIELEQDASTMSYAAPIYLAAGSGGFDPARHLRQLRVTHDRLSDMLAASVRQHEGRREATRVKNARRRERAAVAALAEQEKVEAKKANRRQREEVHEPPLVLAGA